MILLIAIAQPHGEFHVQFSILAWSPLWIQVHFINGRLLQIQQLSLLVFDDKLPPEGKCIVAGGDDLDLVVEINHWFFSFPCFFFCLLLVFLHVIKRELLLDSQKEFLREAKRRT